MLTNMAEKAAACSFHPPLREPVAVATACTIQMVMTEYVVDSVDSSPHESYRREKSPGSDGGRWVLDVKGERGSRMQSDIKAAVERWSGGEEAGRRL